MVHPPLCRVTGIPIDGIQVPLVSCQSEHRSLERSKVRAILSIDIVELRFDQEVKHSTATRHGVKFAVANLTGLWCVGIVRDNGEAVEGVFEVCPRNKLA